jgi:two-component system phosphate regulon response regulator PhoB
MPYERKIVLLVDDDREFLSELQESLALSGYIPVIAATGTEAVKAALRIRPDVILIDLRLGKENGFTVAGKVRKNPATMRIPIIMMSGYFNGSEHSNLPAPSEVNVYLAKPFKQKDVVRSIQTILADKTDIPFDLLRHCVLKI